MLISPAIFCASVALLLGQPVIGRSDFPAQINAQHPESAAWPVAGFIFRYPDIPWPNWSSGHRGVDLELRTETTVFAPASGTVTWAGEVGGESGITISTESGIRHTIMYLEPAVTEGASVERGQIIGEHAISDHCGFSNCIHWSVRDGERYLDPRWLVEQIIVLLP